MAQAAKGSDHFVGYILDIPIFDLTTLTCMVHEAVTRLPYRGYMPLT